jgi:hypothetical protein
MIDRKTALQFGLKMNGAIQAYSVRFSITSLFQDPKQQPIVIFWEPASAFL